MKAMPVLALLAVVAFIVSGCGSGSNVVTTGPITVSGTTTLSSVNVGTVIRCKGGPAARVPHWFGPSYLRIPGVPGLIQLRRTHGSVTVRCRA